MLKRNAFRRFFGGGGPPKKPGLVDFEHPDLTNQEVKDKFAVQTLQEGNFWTFSFFSNPKV